MWSRRSHARCVTLTLVLTLVPTLASNLTLAFTLKSYSHSHLHSCSYSYSHSHFYSCSYPCSHSYSFGPMFSLNVTPTLTFSFFFLSHLLFLALSHSLFSFFSYSLSLALSHFSLPLSHIVSIFMASDFFLLIVARRSLACPMMLPFCSRTLLCLPAPLFLLTLSLHQTLSLSLPSFLLPFCLDARRMLATCAATWRCATGRANLPHRTKCARSR